VFEFRTVISAEAAANATAKLGTKSTGTLQAFGGASGALFVVLPGVGGLAFYSPVLNSDGISTKAVELCNSLKQKYQF
jgi:glutaminase